VADFLLIHGSCHGAWCRRDLIPKLTALGHTIPPEYQVEMTKDWPTDRVHTMQTSHSPFFANPAGLARQLDTFAHH